MVDPKSRVVFMGSPGFAVPTLETLIAADGFDVVQVVTQPDRPKGRGKKVSPTAVKKCAAAQNLPVLEMSRNNYSEIVETLRELEPHFVVVAAFGVILKKDLLSLPSHGCINLHASLLPRHRGVSPIQASLLAGDAETGCTTILMDEGIDTGDMLKKKETPIEDRDTAGSLEERLALLGAPLVTDTLAAIVAGEIRPQGQDKSSATYAKKIRKEHGLIDWTRPAREIWRQVRAMSPWPTAFTEYEGKRLIVLESAVDEDTAPVEPGVIVSLDPFVVGTGGGRLRIHSLKLAGGKTMTPKAFAAGHRSTQGAKLG